MADYHPLIAKAVAGLEKNTGENRRGLYERARTALVAQLRGVTPALSESDITRERLALEEAIRKVESESARKARLEPAARSDSRTAPPIETRPEARPEPEHKPAPRHDDEAGDADKPAPEAPSSTAAELRRPRPRPTGTSSLTDEGLKGFRDVVAEAENLGEATAQAGKTAREAFAAVPTPDSTYERVEPHVEPEGLRPRPRRPAPPPETTRAPLPPNEPSGRDFAAPERGRGRDVPPVRRDRPAQPPAARPAQPYAEDFTGDDFSPHVDRLHRGGEAAFEDEERPSRRARGRAAPEASGRPPKLRSARRFIKYAVGVAIVGALLATLVWQGSNITLLVSRVTSMFASTPAPTQAQRDTAPSRSKIADRVGDPRGQSSPTATVAQKVVLYEEDPADPAGKQYVGSAVWRTEMVSPGAGQPPEMAVRADIDIPDRKIAMRWSLRRNADKALPASHTIEIMFTLPGDFSHGGIQNIPGILMKQSEQTRGVPLAGLAVKVTTNFFLIGLSSVDADMQRNISLLKERSWFDVPVVYNDGRRAILAVEKGTPGDRAFLDAFTSWDGRK